MFTITKSRQVEQIYRGQKTSEGAVVQLTRLFSSNLQRRLDPFLMLDNFASDNPDDYIAGFPDHPHRGFETVTIVYDGEVEHFDSKGNKGQIGKNEVQWMTAGKGILHAEHHSKAFAKTGGTLDMVQLWVNLPSTAKMT